MRKKTHEEYVAELAIKNPNIEVIGTYAGATTKIEHHCLIHDVYWDIRPHDAIRGCGCFKCRGEKIANSERKTHEQYVLELIAINSDIVVVDEYIDGQTPILHHCMRHDTDWMAAPHNVLQGKGCPSCKGEKISSKKSKSHEQYVEELKIVNPNVIVIGEYVNTKTKIKHRCLVHNIDWDVSPDCALQGGGCIECWKEKLHLFHARTHEEYVAELRIVNSNIIAVEQYINANTPILHRCLVDGNEWCATPSSIIYGGCGCPKCNESNGERCVRIWLENNDFKYIRQKAFKDCCDKHVLPFDFYLPDYNTIIEYDGKQHYEPIEYFGGQKTFEYTQKHDRIKNEYCKNHNIKLLRIPYYKNVEEELNNFLFI